MTNDQTPPPPPVAAVPTAPAAPMPPAAPALNAAAPGQIPTGPTSVLGQLFASPSIAAPAPAPTPRKAKRKRVSIEDAAKAYRAIHFPEVKDEHAWSTADGGWAALPRALGLVATVVIKEAHRSKFNSPSAAGVTYLTLWLRSQGNGMARVESEADAALESGYGGERGITTFRKHLRALKDLGFIDYVEESRGRVKWVLLNNPYRVVKRLFDEGKIAKATFSAVQERAQAVGGADEFDAGSEESDGAQKNA